MTPEEKAEQFIREEKQFHLGFLITEQSHPRTRGLSTVLAQNTAQGLDMLYSVDEDIPPVLDKILASNQFQKLIENIYETLSLGRTVYFSGCGATGRLSILLDAASRRYWKNLASQFPDLKAFCEPFAEQTSAVMTGGDFALIRSVESFEDFISFGYRQMKDAGITAGDMLIAISEGGETSSVIGTVYAAADTGAKVHFLFNNPAGLLEEHIVRSREVIQDERVTVHDLTTGPMAIAGSTRMQATTMELLVAGIAFETAVIRLLRKRLIPAAIDRLDLADRSPEKTAEQFRTLLRQLRTPENLSNVAAYIDFETNIYQNNGLVTYFADNYLLDIFTDTTERSPTFKTPPFRPFNDTDAPASWSFVQDPLRPSREAWLNLLRHRPRCINWKPEDYQEMGATAAIIANPPKINEEVLYQYHIGNEKDLSRTEPESNAAVALMVGQEIMTNQMKQNPWKVAFDQHAVDFKTTVLLMIGPHITPGKNRFGVQVDLPQTPLDLFGHLAVKLVLNNLSTAIMGKYGRLSSNWMAHVDASNKKLIDRSIRLVSELTNVDYRTAAVALFESLDEMRSWPESRRKTISPAAWTIQRLQKKRSE